MSRTNVTDQEWDEAASDEARLRLCVRSALLAPSGHNTQPWIFHARDGALELLADRTRALPVVDPDDRELTISCGAALAHVELAAARFGRGVEVELLAEEDPDRLARVRLGPSIAPDPSVRRLFDAMSERHTDRGPYGAEPIATELLDALRAHVEAEPGLWLEAVTDRARKAALADSVAEGDRRQMADRRFRRELAAWVHPNRSRSLDGLPGFTIGITNDVISQAAPLVIRLFDTGQGQAAKDRELAEGSPALLVLGSDDETKEAWLRTGRALARLWLDATASGYAISFLNQPIELPELRGDLDATLERRGFPQLLLRLGKPVTPTDPRWSPRRPLDEVWRD